MNRISTALTVLVSLTGAVSGCCFGGATSTTSTDPLAPVATAPIAPAMPLAPPAPAGLTTVSIAPGFAPDPTTTSAGSAGGPVDASTLSMDCYGRVPAIPQATLRVTQAFANLVVVVNSERDTTLAIRRPDGTYACNDDGGEGVNPRVEGAFPPGDYAIYVGTFSDPGVEPVPYVLGFSEVPAVDATLLEGTAMLRHGQLRVLTATGALGIAPGSLCDYAQVARPADTSGLDVKWRVVCSGQTVYGAVGGYSYRARPDWPAGTIVADADTTGSDTDPAFVWNASGITISDDANGMLGAYALTLQEVR